MRFLDKFFKKKEVESKQRISNEMIKDFQSVESSVMRKEENKVKSQIKRGSIFAHKIQVDDNAVQELKKRYIAFDVETTGLSPTNDKIIEIGAVLFENGEIVKEYGTLVNPEVLIPSSATEINHITNDMIKDAPKEELVYSELVDFLGDALKEQTVICAHNASFDMNFLKETLMRLGYDGRIYFVDTLSLSRNLIKGLYNYKQDTVAMNFNIDNQQSHRAVADAEVCGKILWNLLQIEEKNQEKRLKDLEKSKPSVEEMEVCAYIQDNILKNGGDSKWLGFYKNSSNYVDVSYLYSVIKFKFAKKGKYIIVEKTALANMDYNIEPCTMSEGGADYVRVYFENPFDLEPLSTYIYKTYKQCKKSAMDYFKYNKQCEEEHQTSPAMLNALSNADVTELLESALKRKNEESNSEIIKNSKLCNEIQIRRENVTIHPIHNRVPLSEILNLNEWEKGYDAGYSFWEQGDALRKEGKLEEAIQLFDKARHNGYNAPVLYDSYAMAFHKLKDYDNEIDILDEGIEREKKNGINISRLEARRNKAIQLLFKQQESKKKKSEKQDKEQTKDKTQKAEVECTKKIVGRAILQLTDDLTLVKRYDTIAQAVRETGINSKSIRDAAKGVQKHAGGYVWKYIDEE